MSSLDELFDMIAERWMKRMDATFSKYVKGNLPPQNITDHEEALSILLWLGEAEFKFLGEEVKLISKKPCGIYWDGSKFEIFLKQDSTIS